MNPINDLRSVDMSDWGNPQVDNFSSPLGAPFRALAGQRPRWQPGEFDEWKQAHMLGIPTQYGKQMQQASRMLPGQVRQIENAQMNPALMALMKGIR